jgi:hypothetical protein
MRLCLLTPSTVFSFSISNFVIVDQPPSHSLGDDFQKPLFLCKNFFLSSSQASDHESMQSVLSLCADDVNVVNDTSSFSISISHHHYIFRVLDALDFFLDYFETHGLILET